MAAVRYRKYLKLLELWPVDETKVSGTRDLGTHLRHQISKAFEKGELTKITNETKCDEDYNCLYRIVTDYHRKKYRDQINTTSNVSSQDNKNRKFSNATGLTLEELQMVMSSDGMNVIKTEPVKWTNKFSRLFKKDDD